MSALRCRGCLALLFVAMSNSRAEEQCRFEPGTLRFDDDYECVRDVQNRESTPANFKFIPLEPDGGVYLSLGGEVRQRYEYTDDPLFGADPQDKSGVWLQRFMVHGDLTLGPHIRVFAQLSSAFETGRAGGPSPVDENKLELQNAFVDLNLSLGADATLTLRGGRQEL